MEKGEGVENELIINHAYLMNSPQKSLKHESQRASRLMPAGDVPNFTVTEVPALRTLLDLTLYTS